MSDQRPFDPAELDRANHEHATDGATGHDGLGAGANAQATELPAALDLVPESTPEAAPTGYGYGYGTNLLAASDQDRHLGDYLRVLVKRRWTAITAFLLVFVTITVYTFTATPIYEVRTQILI